MIRVGLINGSPRGQNSASQYFLSEAGRRLDPGLTRTEIIVVSDQLQRGTAEAALAAMNAMDALILAFPLYVDGIPSAMLDFMIRFEAYRIEHGEASEAGTPRVYAIVNNGCIEGTQNRHALQIVEHFANAAGLQWRFGVGIGGGEFLRQTKDQIPLQSKVKRKLLDALAELQADLETQEAACRKNIFFTPGIPQSFYMLAGNMGWIKSANQNGLKRKQLLAQPHRSD